MLLLIAATALLCAVVLRVSWFVHGGWHFAVGYLAFEA
jgi:hypothetical protein